MALDLKEDVFKPIVKRVFDRRDSLRDIKRFSRLGIEGWFKVEIVAALGDAVTSIKNKGADLKLKDETQVEIKAATNFDRNYCTSDPIKKYGCPCLFLGGGDGRAKLTPKPSDVFEIVGLEVFSDGDNDWILGMVKPKT